MRTALFAWELGSNLGHAFPMAAIARRLVEDDVRIVVAGAELDQIALAFTGMPVSRLQAPVWPGRRHFGNQETQTNYLDVLVTAGFADRGKLAAVAGAWRSMLDLVQPDLIVADHSPGLQVACFGGSVPVVAVGTGYTMPPLDYGQFPPIRADRAPIASEAKILEMAAGVQGERGVRPPATLPALFATHRRFVFSFPELDPYRSTRQEPLHLPPEPLPAFVEPPVEPRLFVYLGAEMPGFDTIMQALAEIDIPISAYLRGDVGPFAGFLRLRGAEVYETPPRLADVLPKVSHVLSAGGAFTTHAAFAAGRPQLTMPQQSETRTTTEILKALGVGSQLQPSDDSAAIRDAIYRFVEDRRLINNARQNALLVSWRQQPPGAEAVHAAIVEALG